MCRSVQRRFSRLLFFMTLEPECVIRHMYYDLLLIYFLQKHFHLNKGPNSVTKTDDQESALKNKDSQNIESSVISEVQARISPSDCLDVRDGSSISHISRNTIQADRFNESNDEVKFGLQLGDDFSQRPSSSLLSIDSGTEEGTSRLVGTDVYLDIALAICCERHYSCCWHASVADPCTFWKHRNRV